MLKNFNCLLIAIAMIGTFGLNTLSAEDPTLKSESKDNSIDYFEWHDRKFVDINAAISPTGKWVASSTQKRGQFILWNVKTGKKEKVVKLQNPKAEILDLDFSANSQILIIRELDKSKKNNKCDYSVWDISQPKIKFLYSVCPKWKYSQFTDKDMCFACSPDNKELACTINMGEIHVLELNTGRVIRKIQSNWKYAPDALIFSTDNTRVAQIHLDEFYIWKRQSGTPLLSIKYEMVFSEALQKKARKDGFGLRDLMFKAAEDEMQWTLKNHQKKTELKFNTRITSYSNSLGSFMSPNLSKLVCWQGSAVLIYETETGKLLREFKRNDDVRSNVIFSPDEKSIMMETQEDNIIRQFSIKTGKLLGIFEEHFVKTHEFSFPKKISLSQDGTKLLSHTETSFRVWDVKTQKQIMCKQVINRMKLLESMKRLKK